MALGYLCELDAVRARCKLLGLTRSANANHYQEHLHWECGLDAVRPAEYQPRPICGALAECEQRATMLGIVLPLLAGLLVLISAEARYKYTFEISNCTCPPAAGLCLRALYGKSNLWPRLQCKQAKWPNG